jgi:hypothetical protein
LLFYTVLYLIDLPRSKCLKNRSQVAEFDGIYKEAGSNQVLHVRLGHSWFLAALLIAAHAGIMAVLVIIDIAWWLRAVAIVAIATSLALQLRRSVLRIGDRCAVGLHVGGDDVLVVETRSGGKLQCEVLPGTFVSSLITVLNLRARDDRRRLNSIVCCDCVDADVFRKLRVWLRWKAQTARRGESSLHAEHD